MLGQICGYMVALGKVQSPLSMALSCRRFVVKLFVIAFHNAMERKEKKPNKKLKSQCISC